MKRWKLSTYVFLIISLFLWISWFSFANGQEWQEARMTLPMLSGTVAAVGGSAVAFCTAGATCNNPPGQCDLVCEDIAGSTACVTAGDTVCQNTWTLTDGTRWTLDTNHTMAAGVGCVHTSTMVLSFAKLDGGNEATYLTKTFTQTHQVNFQGHLYFEANTGMVANDEFYVMGLGLYAAQDVVYLRVKRIVDDYKLILAYRDDATAMIDVTGSGTMTPGNWYPIRITYKNDATQLVGFWVDWDNNGSYTDESPAPDVLDTRDMDRIFLGAYTSVGWDANPAFEWAYVALDDDTMPTACTR